jgi:tetratricopeptide (TPR) repeat protein
MALKADKYIRASIGPSWGPWLVFFISLAFYMKTMAPTIGPIDSGELSLACKNLGIAHPTGYPLYTLIGRLWVMLIPFGELAWKLNLMSAIIVASSASCLYRLIGTLELRKEIAFASSLVYAFSPVIWQQAVFLEVYALTALIVVLLLWLAIRYRAGSDPRNALLGFLLAGLGMGNHLNIIWLFPGLLLLILTKKIRSRTVIMSLSLAVVGLSVYFFLPVRSHLGPLFNWGDPSNWERFLWHVTGRQYQVWMFNLKAGELWFNLKRFLGVWLNNPGIFLWWLVIPGMYAICKKDRFLAAGLGAIFILTVFYGINYNIPDIEAYFIPAVIVSLIFISAGLNSIAVLAERLLADKTLLAVKAIITLIFVPLVFLNFKSIDKSDYRLTYTASRDILESAQLNSVILFDNWDLYSACLYQIHNEDLRPDLTIIDKELLRRSWYFNYISEQHPDYFRSCKANIDSFMSQLYLFEHRLPYDPVAIQGRFLRMIDALLLNNYYDNQPYMTQGRLVGDFQQIAAGYGRIPEGLLYRLQLSAAAIVNDSDCILSSKLYLQDTAYFIGSEKRIYRMYPQMLYEKGAYLAQYFEYEESLRYLQQALKYETSRVNLYLTLGAVYLGLNKPYEAIESFNRVLILDPNNKMAKENIYRASAFTPGGPKSFTTELRDE